MKRTQMARWQRARVEILSKASCVYASALHCSALHSASSTATVSSSTVDTGGIAALETDAGDAKGVFPDRLSAPSGDRATPPICTHAMHLARSLKRVLLSTTNTHTVPPGKTPQCCARDE